MKIKYIYFLSLFLISIYSNSFSQNEVQYIWSGAITPNSAKVNAKLSSASTNVRLVVSKSNTFSSPVYSAYVSVSNANSMMAALNISGLEANTKYFYAIESDGILDISSEDIGSFKTFSSSSFSYSFAVGACANSSNHTVYTVMKNMNPLFYLNTGDLHYANPNSTDINVHRLAYETEVLSKPEAADLLRSTPFAYVWDDHDFSGNDSDGTKKGKTSARLAYREYVPHYDLPAGNGDAAIYQSFKVGRIKFILSDLRSERLNGKTMSATQMAWFKNQVTEAADQNLIIAWVSPISFSGTTNDNWGGFSTERTEIGNFLKNQNIKNFFILSGDAHMLAIDNGNNADFSTQKDNPNRYPIFQAAALNRSGSNKGGTYSEGAYPNPTSTTGQFGMVTVTDTGGDDICIKFTGYRVSSGSISYDNIVEYSFCKTLSTTPIFNIISSSTDDAEQKSDNSVDLSSGDLDLGVRPINGLRFSNVNIPQGATITKAYVQFTADKDNQSAAASYTIKGEDVDNASVFTNANGNLSGRSFTSANVNWNNIPAWNTAGESTDAQKTPDLTSILQEIVDKQGWSSGNSLSLFVTGSSGKRSAITYDNDSQKAAKLFVEFELANNYQVSQSSDDAEEATSSMDLNSGDLDFGDKEYNGIRFQNVAIEQGASITNAYIQFTADDNNQSASASYTIYGEDVDNAANFTTANNNLSSRTYTSASVAWNNIPAWNTAGQSGDAQKTPDLSSIVQEIVDRNGWSIGNPMAFFVNGNSGKRSARTYDADPNKAAKLVIEYTTGGRRLNSEETVEEKLMVSEAILPAIYPNPANDVLTIEASNNSEVIIYNLSGKVMKKAVLKTSKNQISISDLPSGFYLLRLENKTYRLIKE